MKLEIRPSTPEDRDALAALYGRCRRLADWLPPKERSRADFVADTRDETVIVAIGRDGVLEGFVSVWPPQSFIHHLYVRPESQRHGVGSALLAFLVGKFPYPWRLKCVRANTQALAFYASHGWKEVGSGSGVQGPHLVLERPE